MTKRFLVGGLVLGLALTGAAHGAPARDDALTLTDSRVRTLSWAVARLDPSHSPYVVVCRRRDGSFAVSLIKGVDPRRPWLDGRRCAFGA